MSKLSFESGQSAVRSVSRWTNSLLFLCRKDWPFSDRKEIDSLRRILALIGSPVHCRVFLYLNLSNDLGSEMSIRF